MITLSQISEAHAEIDDLLAAYHGTVLSQDIGAVLGVLAAFEADLAADHATEAQRPRRSPVPRVAT